MSKSKSVEVEQKKKKATIEIEGNSSALIEWVLNLERGRSRQQDTRRTFLNTRL